MVHKPMKMTIAALNALKDELEYRKAVEMSEAEGMLRQARSYGDLSENAEYLEAKCWIADINQRIAELEAIIADAVIIPDPIDEETIDNNKN